ncbi:PHP domain-containing protein [Candidatus Woesearchaeota archaeon]|nr:PHP domain-containing protein [Candidatus Woesearchaeota archaeon]
MASVIFKKPPLRKLRKEGLFGVDMHFHTRYSLDAVSRIPQAVKKAQRKGFGFAITDHNSIGGVIHSYRLRKHALIIPGIEITCRNGNHVLAYFYDHKEIEDFFNKELKKRMKSNPFFIDISISEVLDLSKKYNCMICAAHPYAPGAVGLMHTGITKKVEKGLKLIEVLNGYNFRRANMNAVYWASKLHKGMTGGSDAHSTYELGKVLTFTHSQEIDDIFREVLKNKSIVMGKEDNVFLKTVMSVRKESAYVNRSGKQKMARQLIKSQLGTEYQYMKEKFRNGRAYHMLTHHHEEAGKK